MITAIEFRERWVRPGDRLVIFPYEVLANAPIPESDRRFLFEAGLPEAAAPFLSFEAPGEGGLPELHSVWPAPSSVSEAWCLGSDGAGSPICMDRSGHVSVYDHDNCFVPCLVNSSVERLCETLLAYREAVDMSRAIAGDDAVLDNQIPAHVQAWFRSEVLRIDPVAAARDSLWVKELEVWAQGKWNA